MILSSTPLSVQVALASDEAEVTPEENNSQSNTLDTTNEDEDADFETTSESSDTLGLSTTSIVEPSSTSTNTDVPSTEVNSHTTSTTTNIIATTTSITTGDAIAASNILSVVNTTAVNSSGEVIFAHLTDNQTTNLDLRPNASSSTCVALSCVSTRDVTIDVENTATIENDIFLEAITGNNELSSNIGEAIIKTGDAFTGLNLVTIANSTFVDSQYLIVTINAFRDVRGDIIFPGLTDFFSTAASSNPVSTNVANSAQVSNSIEAQANTGTNSASGLSSHIQTGEAKSVSQSINAINSALQGGSSMMIMLKVHGSWLGELQGLLPEIKVEIAEDGTYYLSNDTSRPSGEVRTDVSASNTAQILTNATLIADTGNNNITSNSTSTIDTGNALIGANVVNVANATVIGRNWTLAIINIFGDFIGNLAFGRPDLWIGEEISTPSIIKNGSEVTYTYTMVNTGDAVANEVTIEDSYDARYLRVTDSTHEFTDNGDGTITWNLAEPLAVGASKELSYTAIVQNTNPGTEITNTVSISAYENDNDMIDNTDTGTITATKRSNKSTVKKTTQDSKEMSNQNSLIDSLIISRSNASTTINNTNNEIIQEIVIANPTSYSFSNISLKDNLRSQSVSIIKTEFWDIGTILPNEEITLQYAITFMPEALSGTYNLDTSLLQNNSEIKNNLALGTILYSPVVSTLNTSLLVIPDAELQMMLLDPIPRILGTTTSEITDDKKPNVLGTLIASADDGSNRTFTTPSILERLLFPLLGLILLLTLLYYRRKTA